MITVVEIIMQNVLLTENKLIVLNYNKGNYEQMKSLFNQDFVKTMRIVKMSVINTC